MRKRQKEYVVERVLPCVGQVGCCLPTVYCTPDDLDKTFVVLACLLLDRLQLKFPVYSVATLAALTCFFFIAQTRSVFAAADIFFWESFCTLLFLHLAECGFNRLQAAASVATFPICKAGTCLPQPAPKPQCRVRLSICVSNDGFEVFGPATASLQAM